MTKCPMTYEECEQKFSKKGLNQLSRKLESLEDIPLTAAELRLEAVKRASKMSVQGVQSKLSAVLKIKERKLEIVDLGGRYILKPQSDLYPELPENEDLSMHLAKEINIEVPVHGLMYAKDKSLIYFIKRFDRVGKEKKIHVEDFAQLAGETRDTKYNFSMERLVPIIDKHCTVPVIEKAELFKRTVFNFLIGNEDMHLKNYSLIVRDNQIKLAPAYDFLNSTIAIGAAREELALPLKGKKRGMTKAMIIKYWGEERLQLSTKVVAATLSDIQLKFPKWSEWISSSFLSTEMKQAYLSLVIDRARRLELDPKILSLD